MEFHSSGKRGKILACSRSVTLGVTLSLVLYGRSLPIPHTFILLPGFCLPLFLSLSALARLLSGARCSVYWWARLAARAGFDRNTTLGRDPARLLENKLQITLYIICAPDIVISFKLWFIYTNQDVEGRLASDNTLVDKWDFAEIISCLLLNQQRCNS